MQEFALLDCGLQQNCCSLHPVPYTQYSTHTQNFTPPVFNTPAWAAEYDKQAVQASLTHLQNRHAPFLCLCLPVTDHVQSNASKCREGPVSMRWLSVTTRSRLDREKEKVTQPFFRYQQRTRNT
jgi:hypothetical protein